MKILEIMMVFTTLSSCSGTNFSSPSASKEKVVKPASETDEDPGLDDDGDGSSPTPNPRLTPSPTPSPTKSVVIEQETVINPCLLSATGEIIVSAIVSGENCINNGVDTGGADFNDYNVTINGDLLKDGWQFFSRKEQDLQIQYNLGSPGSTTQVVSMQVVDCAGKEAGKFDVSSGSGTRTLKARLGDRFTLVTSITSGCYGRRDVYDLLRDKEKAFRIR